MTREYQPEGTYESVDNALAGLHTSLDSLAAVVEQERPQYNIEDASAVAATEGQSWRIR